MSELAKFAALLGALLVLNSVLADWYRDVVMWNGISEKTARQLEREPEGIDTLVLGDSHAKRGLYPSVLGRAFNLAIPGQKYSETYYVLKDALENGQLEVATVILPADLHSLSSWNLDNFMNAHYYARAVDYFEIGRRRGKTLLYAIRGLQGRYAPYVGGRRNILSYWESGRPRDLIWLADTPMLGGALVDARSIRDRSPEQRVEQAKGRTGFHFVGERLVAPMLEEYLRDIVALCASRGVEVIFVQYPVTPEYLDAAAEHVDIEAFDRHFEDLARERPSVHLVRSRRMFDAHPDFFLDVDHLNEAGANALSKVIRDRVLEPLRRARSG